MSNQLVAEFKTYKLLETLTSRAQNLFSSRDSYMAFISQMNFAYSKGLNLGDFAFALDILKKIDVDNQFLLSARKAEGMAKINATTSATPQTEENKTQPSQIGAIIEHFIVKRITTSVKQAIQTIGAVGSGIKTAYEEIKNHFTKQVKVVPVLTPDDDNKKQPENPENPENPISQEEMAKLSGLFTSSTYYQKHKAETIKRIEKYYLGIKPDEDKLIEELKSKNLDYYEYQKELAKIKFESKYFNVINAFVRGEITAQQFEQITSGKETPATPATIDVTKISTTNTAIDVGGVVSTGGASYTTNSTPTTNSTSTGDSNSTQITYHDLLVRAKEVFPTTQSYNDFVSQIDIAIQNGEKLTSIDFALTTFETLKASENSPYYQDELARISADPQFSTFATIAENLNVTYAQPLFTATKEISVALEDNSTLGVDTSIVATVVGEEEVDDLMSQVKQTNKVVLQVDSNGLVSNPEVLFNSDGIIGKENVTTSKLEQSKMEALSSQISAAANQDEASDIVNNYNTELSSSPISPVEMAETFTGNMDIGMTNDNPIAKETQGLSVDSSTATQLEEEEEEALKIYEETVKKQRQDEDEAVVGVAPAEGPSLEA
ncbi:MAG: hypothetical protein IJW32_03810 [Clostridia bacterium]|nr:hypothetical protein [Clostridia bacterium]